MFIGAIIRYPVPDDPGLRPPRVTILLRTRRPRASRTPGRMAGKSSRGSRNHHEGECRAIVDLGLNVDPYMAKEGTILCMTPC
jgi:hypothetical protein